MEEQHPVLARLAHRLRGAVARHDDADEFDERPDPDLSEWERMDDEDDIDGQPTQ